jgi:uncharacterized surface anchored protein
LQLNGEWFVGGTGTDVFTTNAEGKIKLRYIALGEYTVQEVLAVPGYSIAPPVKVIVTELSSMVYPAAARVLNQPLTLILTKTDGYTHAPLKDVEFRLIDGNGAVVKMKMAGLEYHVDAAGGSTFKTNADGRATIRYIPSSVYTIEEVKPLPGYAQMEKDSITVLDSNDNTHPAQATLTNKPIMLEVTKVDAMTAKPSARLQNAAFRLLDGSNQVVKLIRTGDHYRPSDSGSETFIVEGANSTAKILYLTAGTNYTIEEVTAPLGYGTALPVTAAIKGEHSMDAPLKVSIEDKPLLLKLYKVKKKNNDPLTRSVQHAPLTSAGERVILKEN